MRIDVITIFPEVLAPFTATGMIRQARSKGILDVRAVNLRDFATDRHRVVDDRPYGGGQGMVLKAEPVFRAVEACGHGLDDPPWVVLLTPQGTVFSQEKAVELSLRRHLVLVCGRYEGVDQRVADHLVDEEISIGDFILAGGEPAAIVVVDAVTRLIPGVVGKGESVLAESFMDSGLDWPVYTRPEEFRGWKVPEVLLSGDHDAVRRWRQQEAQRRTEQRRPDLLEEVDSSDERIGISPERDVLCRRRL